MLAFSLQDHQNQTGHVIIKKKVEEEILKEQKEKMFL
jgi:hypothetical protein